MAEDPGLSLREKVKRRLINMPERRFNVLVVGMPGHGKSSFINSMSMAVIGTWKEIAEYGGDGTSTRRVTIRLKSCPMFDDDCHEVDEPHPMPDYRKNIVFWDCAGFNDANEEVYSTIASLTLDGRIPSGTNVIECMKQCTPSQLKRKFPRKVSPKITFDRIVFVLAANTNVPKNLVEAIEAGAQKDHDVPIFVVVTNIDKCPNQNNQEERVKGAQAAFNLTGNQVRFRATSLYCHELTKCEDPYDYRVMKPNDDIDKNLLNIWMHLTDPIHKVIAAKDPPSWGQWLGCVTQ